MPDFIASLTSKPQSSPLRPTNPLTGQTTDFSQIKGSPLPNQEKTETNTHTWEEDPNKERREDRVKRENLLRYYEAELTNAQKELSVVDGELKELENKIRAEEKEVELLAREQEELTSKIKRNEKMLHRYRFELRSHKGEEMDKRIVQRRWQDTVKEAMAKLKKIKYGDWKAIRR
ncbi:MAG: hypothetical protein FJZ04_01380 [Candidatus Moranbacteria bacterium]|nr:hypothetical protein [Candidatus Moranbacteria bacterium]